MSVDSMPTSPPLKRKRQEAEDDLEIDLSLPEPLSKKDARKAKKRKDKPVATVDSSVADGAEEAADSSIVQNGEKEVADEKQSKRSEFGIWIGNLPFSVTKLDVRQFLCKDGNEVEDKDITRVHMPAHSSSEGGGGPAAKAQKPKNKGFAYVDFTTAEVLAKAMRLSEQLLLGRRVLIKNATSFEGRPAANSLARTTGFEQAGKPASRRVFIGNLAFTVDAEQLKQHFSQCGVVADVHVATFEDSGKCKGYAWVTFEELEGAAAAVRGFVLLENIDDGNEQDDEAGEAEPKRPLRPRRNAVDRIEGRVLRREFAEDKTVRYNKRFGKGSRRDEQQQENGDSQPIKGGVADSETGAGTIENSTTAHSRRRDRRLADKHSSTEKAKQRYIPHDTRPRPSKATGSIPVGQAVGTKVSFD